MRKIPVFFICVLFCVLSARAQFWTLKAGGTTLDEGLDISIDASGNTYTTGYFSSTAGFGIPTLSASGLTDIFVSKVSPAGAFLWTIKAGGAGVDRGLAIRSDAAGNTYVTGYFSGNALFGAVAASSAGNKDIFLAKYNTSGVLQWVRQAGGSLDDLGNGITIDHSGNVIVTGEFSGVCNWGATQLTSQTNSSTGLFTPDVFTAKYDAAGNVIWVKKGSGEHIDRGIDVVVDNSNNVYVTGQFSDSITFDNTHLNPYFNAAFLVKYDSTGQEQWFQAITANSAINSHGLVINSSNELILTGDFLAFAYFTDGSATIPYATLASLYPNAIFLAKYSSSGSLIWDRSYSSWSSLEATNIALNNAGDSIFVIGNFRCTFEEFAGITGDSSGTFNSVGFEDIYVAKFDALGNWVYGQQVGGKGADNGYGITVNTTNNPIITGSFYGALHTPWVPNLTGTITNSPGTFCGDANYGKFGTMNTAGVSDIFIINAITPNRKPYDYYFRNGSPCSRPRRGVCVDDPVLVGSCPDTITSCDFVACNAYPNTGLAGPDYNYLWDDGSTFGSATYTTDGEHSVIITSVDGCYTSHDSAYVHVNPLPVAPLISDSYGINFNTSSPVPITACLPASVTLTGNSMGCPAFGWSRISPPGTMPPGLTCNVTSSGLYQFTVTNAFGCSANTQIMVTFSNPIPPVGLKIILPFTAYDTTSICDAGAEIVFIYDTISNPTANFNCIPAQSSVAWTVTNGITTAPYANGPCPDVPSITWIPATSGTYTITATVIRNNPCNGDTIVISKVVTINIYASPTVTIVGDIFICAGDSTQLTGLGANSHYNWTGPAGGISGPADQPSIWVVQFGAYSVVGFDSSGCNTPTTVQIHPKPNPVITANPASAIICPNDSVAISVNISPGSYQWWGPGGLMPDTNQTVYVTVAGTYYCVVTDTDQCELLSGTVDILPYSVPVITTSPDHLICPGELVTLHVIPNHPVYSLSWLAPLSGLNLTQVVDTEGIYHCTVTTCGIPVDLQSIVNEGYPEAHITAAGPTAFCFGDSVELDGNLGMTTYYWNPGGSVLQNMTAYASATYTLTTGDGSGCYATDTATVNAFNFSPPAINDTTICFHMPVLLTLIAAPNADWFTDSVGGTVFNSGHTLTTDSLVNDTVFYVETTNGQCHSTRAAVHVTIDINSFAPTVFGNSPVCEGDTLHLFSGAGSSLTFSWNGPNGFSSSSAFAEIVHTALTDSGFYSLVVSDLACHSPATSYYVQVSPTPPDPLLASNTPLCVGDSLIFNAASGTVIYSWSGPNGFSSSIQDPFIYPAALSDSGTYYLHTSIGLCESPEDSVQIIIHPVPSAPLLSSNSPVCEGDSLLLNSNAISGASYSWTGPAGYISAAQDPVISQVALSQSGNFILEILVDGCKNNSSVAVTVKPLPNPLNPANTGPVCPEGNIQLSANLFSNGTYSWHGPHGFSSLLQNPELHQLSPADTGLFFVSAMLDGCNGKTESTTVSMYENPGISLGSDTVLCNFDTLLLSAGEGFAKYLWSDLSSKPDIVVRNSGSYHVLVTDDHGCEGEAGIRIAYKECPGTYHAYNIFTPNGDGGNDLFGFDNTDYLFLNCKIYNRWGGLIYEFSSSGKKWDGTIQASGEKASDGVYYYIADFSTFSGGKIQLRGFVELIR